MNGIMGENRCSNKKNIGGSSDFRYPLTETLPCREFELSKEDFNSDFETLVVGLQVRGVCIWLLQA